VPFDPFAPSYRLKHFGDHGADFGALTIGDYEAMADHFMTKVRSATMVECIRQPQGDILCRYDTATGEYGVVYIGGHLITYFRPIPGAHIPVRARPRNMHGYLTNMDYFVARC
jgi:pyocin large subunit-like protein